MELSPLQTRIDPASLPPERLADHPQLSEQAKVAELSRQFEAVLLRQILGSAQKTMFPSSANPQSFGGEVYRDMIVQNLADGISQSGDFGLATSLQTQLGRQLRVPPTEPDSHPL